MRVVRYEQATTFENGIPLHFVTRTEVVLQLNLDYNQFLETRASNVRKSIVSALSAPVDIRYSAELSGTTIRVTLPDGMNESTADSLLKNAVPDATILSPVSLPSKSIRESISSKEIGNPVTFSEPSGNLSTEQTRELEVINDSDKVDNTKTVTSSIESELSISSLVQNIQLPSQPEPIQIGQIEPVSDQQNIYGEASAEREVVPQTSTSERIKKTATALTVEQIQELDTIDKSVLPLDPKGPASVVEVLLPDSLRDMMMGENADPDSAARLEIAVRYEVSKLLRLQPSLAVTYNHSDLICLVYSGNVDIAKLQETLGSGVQLKNVDNLTKYFQENTNQSLTILTDTGLEAAQTFANETVRSCPKITEEMYQEEEQDKSINPEYIDVPKEFRASYDRQQCEPAKLENLNTTKEAILNKNNICYDGKTAFVQYGRKGLEVCCKKFEEFGKQYGYDKMSEYNDAYNAIRLRGYDSLYKHYTEASTQFENFLALLNTLDTLKGDKTASLNINKHISNYKNLLNIFRESSSNCLTNITKAECFNIHEVFNNHLLIWDDLQNEYNGLVAEIESVRTGVKIEASKVQDSYASQLWTKVANNMRKLRVSLAKGIAWANENKLVILLSGVAYCSVFLPFVSAIGAGLVGWTTGSVNIAISTQIGSILSTAMLNLCEMLSHPVLVAVFIRWIVKLLFRMLTIKALLAIVTKIWKVYANTYYFVSGTVIDLDQIIKEMFEVVTDDWVVKGFVENIHKPAYVFLAILCSYLSPILGLLLRAGCSAIFLGKTAADVAVWGTGVISRTWNASSAAINNAWNNWSFSNIATAYQNMGSASSLAESAYNTVAATASSVTSSLSGTVQAYQNANTVHTNYSLKFSNYLMGKMGEYSAVVQTMKDQGSWLIMLLEGLPFPLIALIFSLGLYQTYIAPSDQPTAIFDLSDLTQKLSDVKDFEPIESRFVAFRTSNLPQTQ